MPIMCATSAAAGLCMCVFVNSTENGPRELRPHSLVPLLHPTRGSFR